MPLSDDETITPKAITAYLPKSSYQSVKEYSKSSIPWRLHKKQDPNFEVFNPEQIEQLSASHGVDQETLQELSRSIGRALLDDVRVLSIETFGERKKKGVLEIRKALKHITAMQERLISVHEILSILEFGDTLATNKRPETSLEHQKYCHDVEEAINNLGSHLAEMAHTNKVIFEGPPDKRRLRDLRRQMICNSIFKEWQSAGRTVSSTTNPVTGDREGPLIAFVNDVVALVTEPSTRLSGETIHSEIVRFKNTKPIGRSA